jgi:AcrR family transcriptional regulator
VLYTQLVHDVKRGYHSPVREEQARRTRDRILEEAAHAFAYRGWAGTTVAEVAKAAGVTPQAVHQSVGAKPALLIGAVRSAVAGSGNADGAVEDSAPLREREPFRTAYDGLLPVRKRAEAFAAGTRGVYDRAGALFLVLAQTAPAEPDLAALWQDARARRLADCRRLVRTAGHTGAGARRRADEVYVQSGPGVHAELSELGWTGRAYERWLTDQVAQLLT